MFLGTRPTLPQLKQRYHPWRATQSANFRVSPSMRSILARPSFPASGGSRRLPQRRALVKSRCAACRMAKLGLCGLPNCGLGTV
eukprot:6190920-Pleurochrysis_carterae.AAC.1